MNYTWTAISDGNFNVSTNWQDENEYTGVPGINDSITLTGSARCTVNVNATVKNVYTEGYTGRLYTGTNQTLTVANGEFILAANATGSGSGNIKLVNSTLRIKSGGTTQRLIVQDSSIVLEKDATITPCTFIGSTVISGSYQLSVTAVNMDETAEVEVQTGTVLRIANAGNVITGGRFFGEGSVWMYSTTDSNVTTFSGTQFECSATNIQRSSFVFMDGAAIKNLGNRTTSNVTVTLDNVKIENWNITLASSRTFTFDLNGPLELTGNVTTTGTASAINFTQGTDGEIILTGEADQSIQLPFEGVKIVLDKPSGEVDFIGVDCLLESKESRDPGENDPRTVSEADLIFNVDTEVTLSGSVFVASVDNFSSIIVPALMVLDTYSYTGQEDSTISGGGTLRVHEDEYESDGTDTIDIEYWGTVLPPATPTGLTPTAVSSTRINLTWNSVADATEYILETSLNGVDNWAEIYRGSNTLFAHT